MGIFGDDKAQEIEALQLQISEAETKRKKLGHALNEERKRTEALGIALDKATAELAAVKRTVQKARERQKASVERANRFKARLRKISSSAIGS